MSPSRNDKLQRLIRSISRGDLAAASELLRAETRRAGRRDARVRPAPEAPKALELACPGVEAAAGGGTYWLVCRSAAEVAPDAAALAERYAAVLRGAGQRFDELQASAGLCHAADAGPADLLFVDAEACPPPGPREPTAKRPSRAARRTPPPAVFLLGVMSYQAGTLQVEQCLAREPAEEPTVLRVLADRLASAGVLVTFARKGGGMALIRKRWAACGIDLWGQQPPHLDLRKECRTRWRGQVPNVRMETLERCLFRRRRAEPLTAAAARHAYRHFVETHDAGPLSPVLAHNAANLRTMAELLVLLLTSRDPAVE